MIRTCPTAFPSQVAGEAGGCMRLDNTSLLWCGQQKHASETTRRKPRDRNYAAKPGYGTDRSQGLPANCLDNCPSFVFV